VFRSNLLRALDSITAALPINQNKWPQGMGLFVNCTWALALAFISAFAPLGLGLCLA
jgi:hypothetical protein